MRENFVDELGNRLRRAWRRRQLIDVPQERDISALQSKGNGSENGVKGQLILGAKLVIGVRAVK